MRRPKAGPRAGRPGIGLPGRGRGLSREKNQHPAACRPSCEPERLRPFLVPSFSLVLSNLPGRAASVLLTVSARCELLLSSLPFPRGSARPQRRCASSRTCAPSPSTPPRAAPLPTTVWGLRAGGSSRSPWWGPAAWARPVSSSEDPAWLWDGTWETPARTGDRRGGRCSRIVLPFKPLLQFKGATVARGLSG